MYEEHSRLYPPLLLLLLFYTPIHAEEPVSVPHRAIPEHARGQDAAGEH